LGKLDHHINQPIRETLISEILETGLSLDDISIVFMTHLHLDHVGTNMTKTETGWAPTFKNAKYMVSKEDWDLFSRLTDSKQFEYIKEQVTPLIDLGIISFFSGETYISDEVITFPTPGHTPGHTSLIIKSGNETAVVLGDSAHIPPQVEETHWSPKADRNSSLSEQSRQKIMKYIEENGSIIASGHFPSPGFGTIITQNNKNTYQTL
jgi:glyoxylase-like metal-dependent hydrolase (beta-lactamase superfamily II)